MNLTVNIDNLKDANKFLRCLWAELRKVCGRCAFNFAPFRDGPRQEVWFGHVSINRPEGALLVGVNYVERGTIRSVLFAHDFGTPVAGDSELGQLLQSVVQSTLAKWTSLNRVYLESKIECLSRPPQAYESDRIRFEPIADNRFSLCLTIDAYDEIDSRTQCRAKINDLLDVLSVETNSAFWPTIKEIPEPDEPRLKQGIRDRIRIGTKAWLGRCSKVFQRSHPTQSETAGGPPNPPRGVHSPDDTAKFVFDPEWIDEYPIQDGNYVISPEGLNLLRRIAEEGDLSGDPATFLRACHHFHTARKYAAQASELFVYGQAVPIPGQANAFSIPFSARDSRLQIAGQMGAAHAEITGALYMSALEVASKIGAAAPQNCGTCGQAQYKITQRVVDLMRSTGGEHLGVIAKDYYVQRSKYLHEGTTLSASNYEGTSIPQLDPSDPSGCRCQVASPSPNLKEYAGFALRKVLKRLQSITTAD